MKTSSPPSSLPLNATMVQKQVCKQDFYFNFTLDYCDFMYSTDALSKCAVCDIDYCQALAFTIRFLSSWPCYDLTDLEIL